MEFIDKTETLTETQTESSLELADMLSRLLASSAVVEGAINRIADMTALATPMPTTASGNLEVGGTFLNPSFDLVFPYGRSMLLTSLMLAPSGGIAAVTVGGSGNVLYATSAPDTFSPMLKIYTHRLTVWVTSSDTATASAIGIILL